MNAGFRDFFTKHLNGEGFLRRIARLADFIGASSDEIAWVSGTTEAMNVVANGLALPAGSEIVTHTQEHPAGVYPWLYRASRDGLSVRQLPYPMSVQGPEELVDFFAAALGPETQVLSFSHVNYGDGVEMPVKEICAMARRRGVLTVVDGAQAVGMLDVSVPDLGCDIYATSLHKWCGGIYGSGLLYIRQDLQERVAPLMVETHHGFRATTRYGETELPASVDIRRDWPLSMNKYSTLFIYCGPILEGTLVALQELSGIGMDRVEHEMRRLAGRLRAGLKDIPGVTVHTPQALAAGITAFNVDGQTPGEVISRLSAGHRVYGRIVDHGAAGFSAARLCTHVFNSDADVDAAIAAVDAVAQGKEPAPCG